MKTLVFSPRLGIAVLIFGTWLGSPLADSNPGGELKTTRPASTSGYETTTVTPLEFGVYCSCGKGIYSAKEQTSNFLELKEEVLNTCNEFYPEQKENSIQCSDALPLEYVCFINNGFDGAFQFMMHPAPSTEVALETAGYDWRDKSKSVQVLGCSEGPLDPDKHLGRLNSLEGDIWKQCSTEIEAHCKDFASDIHKTVSCLKTKGKKQDAKSCLDTLTFP